MRWLRSFVDKLTGKGGAESSGPRRRADERFSYKVRLEARCSSWPKFEQLFTGDVSAQGLFVPTDQETKLGETIEMRLVTPGGEELIVSGVVVRIVDTLTAARFGKARGLGVRLELNPATRAAFEVLLAEARDMAPAPEAYDGEVEPRALSQAPVTPPPPRVSQQLPALAPSSEGVDVDLGLDVSASEPAFDQAIHDAPTPQPPRQPPPPPASGKMRPITERPPPPRPPATGSMKPVSDAAPGTGKMRPVGGPMRTAVNTAPRGRIVGIDLGTTFTSVSAAHQNRVMILPRDDGDKAMPSVLAFPMPGRTLVGAPARDYLLKDPRHTVQSPKRLLGRRHDERSLEGYLAQAAWKHEAGPDGTVLIDMWDDKYAIVQLCAMILADARDAAEKTLGAPIRGAVITVPVTFDEPRLKLVRRAAQLARLDVAALIDEPSAAALANRFQPGFGGTVGVYDFGGGTFDFTVVDVSTADFKVMATAGDAWLGGDDFDTAIADAVANQVFRAHGIDVRKDAVDWQRLLFAAEKAKRELTGANETQLVVPELLRGQDLKIRVDRNGLDQVCAQVIGRSLATCDEALELMDLKPQDLTAVYISGGTTYIPAVRAAIAKHFGVPIKTGVPPEHAVCVGAGIHAAQLEMQGHTTLDQVT
jgi:actin-like ATPase involved in cell morphogenesis/Tfp pilus assembly protein PilZ